MTKAAGKETPNSAPHTQRHIKERVLSPPGAGYFHHFFYPFVQDQYPGILRGPVVDLLALAARADEALIFELPQMVRDGRTAHIHHGGNVDDALFAMAKQPENAQAAAVAEQLKEFGDDLKIFDIIEALL